MLEVLDEPLVHFADPFSHQRQVTVEVAQRGLCIGDTVG